MASWGWPTYVSAALDEKGRKMASLDNAPSLLGRGGASSSEAASTLQDGNRSPGAASLDSDVQRELDWIDKQILWAADGPLTAEEHEPRMLDARAAYIDRLTRERARLEKLL